MILSDNPKRACIYFIWDKDGIIDDYVVYQINDLKKNVDFLHCVINGNLKPEGLRILSEIADEVFVRENKGNDIGAYKAAIEHIGWKKLSGFDEIILTNNTCFGPVYPFKEVFDWAKKKDIDFWGLTYDEKTDWLHSTDYLHYNEAKLHIQSYFYVFRKPLLGSELLKEFFEEIPDNASYVESGCFYEYALPGYFEEKGYKGAVYCTPEEETETSAKENGKKAKKPEKTVLTAKPADDEEDDFWGPEPDDEEEKKDKTDNNYALLHNPVELLKKYRMPLFKKRSFIHHYTDILNNSGGEAAVRLIKFIENETDYDMDMVWQNILRTGNLADIVRCVHLNRVLPENVIINSGKRPPMKLGVVYHAFYEDQFEENLIYLKNFPAGTNILVSTDTEEKKKLLGDILKKLGISARIILSENRGRDVSVLLVGASDFVSGCDLVCFAHDRDIFKERPYGIKRSCLYRTNKNIFATKEYVANVIDMFAKEKRLGIAFPTAPNHGYLLYHMGDGWFGNFSNTSRLLKELGANVKMNEHSLCVAPIETCFWFRPAALKKLFDGPKKKGWSYKNFPSEPNRWDSTIVHAISRSFAYFAQDAGYYPVYLYNSDYAAIEFTNLEFGKVGSIEMREWCDKNAMNAIGYTEANAKNDGSAVNAAVVDIKSKHPVMWKILFPIRIVLRKILKL